MPRVTSFPSEPNNNGSYRVTVGKSQFNLGTDRLTAQRKFNALLEWWEYHVPGDGNEKKWTPELIAKAFTSVATNVPVMQQTPDVAPVAQPVPVPQHAPVGLTLHQGFALYIANLKERGEANDGVNVRRWRDAKWRINKIKAAIQDRPLSELTSVDDLKRVLRYPWTRRPEVMVRGKNTVDANGKKRPTLQRRPISIVYACDLIAQSGAALRWLDQNNHWIAPRHFQLAFTVNGADKIAMMRTDEEAKARKAPQCFTLDEVKTLYKCASRAIERTLILSGVFLGWTQKELATLRKDQLVEEDGELFIEKSRSKTKVQGKWWVCPQLAKLLRESAATTKGDLVVRTPEGNPLIFTSPAGNECDCAAVIWWRLRDLAVKKGVRRLPYKTFRKFAGQSIKNLGGHEMGKVFLAHSLGENGRDVNEKHYTSSGTDTGVGETLFSQLHKVQRRMYAELAPHLFPTSSARTSDIAA